MIDQTVGDGSDKTTTFAANDDMTQVKVKGSDWTGNIRLQEKIPSLTDTDDNWDTVMTVQGPSNFNDALLTPDSAMEFRFIWTNVTGDPTIYFGS
jgi:hypothetical protein